jgi:hypothetical protein
VTRERVINFSILAAVIAGVIWVALNTYWTEVTVTTPLQGEAATNPFYGVERLLHALGIRTHKVASPRLLPPTSDVLFIDDLQHDLARTPIEPLERWVESGGRLAVTGEAVRSTPSLQTWSGITPLHWEPDRRTRTTPPTLANVREQDCSPMAVQINGVATGETLRVCGQLLQLGFASRHVPAWALSSAQGLRALRVTLGRGSLVVTGPRYLLGSRAFLREDDAQAFIDAIQLGRGDRLSVLSAASAERLLSILWRLGAPAILCFGIALLLTILRYLPRFGPLAPTPIAARRSLAEQIRANARMARRTGKMGALRAAVRRALERSAQQRIAGYRSFNARQQAIELAARAGVDPAELNAALTADAAGNAAVQQAAITLLERTRRALSISPRPHKGNGHVR